MYEELVKRLRVEGEYADLVAYMHGIRPISPKDDAAEIASSWKELFAKAAEAIEELSKPKWIPVTERFPEEWIKVMTYQPTLKARDGLRRVGVFIGNDRWREAERHNLMELPVTHWMPLPEPPKEET